MHLFHPAVGGDFARFQKNAAAAYMLRPVQHMACEQGDAVLVSAPEQISFELDQARGIDSVCGFIQKKKGTIPISAMIRDSFRFIPRDRRLIRRFLCSNS